MVVSHVGCPCPGHPAPEDDWRHVVSEVAPGLFVTGEPLGGDPGPLGEWERLGVELVVDLTDGGRPLARPSSIRRVWLPTPDDGSPRDPSWLAAVAAAGAQPNVLVHCHMGVARAPSAAFLLLLGRGVDEIEAVTRVLTARPIAAANYAADVLRWHLQTLAGESPAADGRGVGRGQETRPDAGVERRVAALEDHRLRLVAAHRERLLREAAG